MKKIVSRILIVLLPLAFNLLSSKMIAQEIDSTSLHYKLNLNISVDEAWNLWTTNDGIKKFFAPDCNVDLNLGGSYEIYFFPLKPQGQKGTDSSIVLSFIPRKMLSVEWGVPRWFESRKLAMEPYKRTYLVIFFSEGPDPNTSEINFYHLGFGQGSDWQQVIEYFDSSSGWQSIFKRLEAFANTNEATNWDLLKWTKIKE
ncbi:MAG TPA: SRPBCC domain-containing protein [Ignavibacteriaceae bacterium]|nr:SRPBCC domain-containing protein [Ignavibacteriaceae bacterium]